MFKSDWQLPQFLGFFKRLLIARWPSLLLLSLGVCLPLLVFEQLAMVIWQNEGGFLWDEPLLLAIHARTQPQLDTIAATLTRFGGFAGILPMTAAIALALLYFRRWRSLAYLLTTLPGSMAINRTAKEFLHRVRPSLWESPPELNYSFPSGHATASMTLVAALVILTWGSKWCWLVLVVGSGFVLAIGWTRLYLGVHFPSDILAGWLVSVAWAIGVSLLIRPHPTKPNPVDTV